VSDPLYPDALRVVKEAGYASTSMLRTALDIGYVRAVHLIDLLEENGVIGPARGADPRLVLKDSGEQKGLWP